MTDYRTVQPQAPAEPLPATRYTPVRAPSVHSDVLVPLAQAGVTALLLAVSAGIVAWLFGVYPDDALKVATVVGMGVLVAAWFLRVGWAQSTVEKLENYTGVDLDGDKRVGRSPVIVNPDMARQAAQEREEAERLQASYGELLLFLRQCYVNGTSEQALKVRSPSAREKYTELREALMALGLAKWKDDKQKRAGWKLAIADQQQAERVLRQHVLHR